MKKIKCSKCKENLVEVEDNYKEEYCCDGSNGCACKGQSTNPEFCDECTQELFGVSRKEWAESYI